MLVLRLVLFIVALTGWAFAQTDSLAYQIHNREGDPNYHRQRKEYIRVMHSAALGVDWRLMDWHTRRLRLARPNLGTNGAAKTSEFDTVANGRLTGEWLEKGSANQSGRIHLAEPDFNAGRLYAASAGGNIWSGRLNGSDWRNWNDHFKMNDIRFLRLSTTSGAKRLYVADRNVFYYTDVDEVQWQVSRGLEAVQTWGSILAAALTLDTIFVLTHEFDFAKRIENIVLNFSIDKGASFSKVIQYDKALIASEEAADLWTKRDGRGPVYLAMGRRIYLLGTSGQPVYLSELNVASARQVILTGQEIEGKLTLFADVNGIIYTGDNAVNWQRTGSEPEGPFRRTSFSASITKQNRLYFGGVNCHFSSNKGADWGTVNDWSEYYGNPSSLLHADVSSVVSVQNPAGDQILYIGTDGGLYTSDDDLQTVHNLSLNGLNVSQYYSVYSARFDPNIIYVGSQDQGFQWSHDAGPGPLPFEQTISGDYGHLVSGDDGVSIWSVYPGFVLYYPNAERADKSNQRWDFRGSQSLWMPPLLAEPRRPKTAWLGLRKLMRLEIRSGTITAQEMPYDFASAGGGFISALAISPHDEDYRYAMTSTGSFFTTSDAGVNWQVSPKFDLPNAHWFYGSAVWPSPLVSGKVYIGGSGYSNPPVFVTEDNGKTFLSMSEGLPNTLVYQITGTPSDSFLFAATEVGPYVYVTAENKWYSMLGREGPDQIFWSVEYLHDEKIVRFATHGRGIWDFIIKDDTVQVGRSKPEQTAFLLQQFPNPASDYVYVAYQMDKPKQVHLTLSDVAGKAVRQASFTTHAGIGTLHLDIRDVVPGVYTLNWEGGRTWKVVVYRTP